MTLDSPKGVKAKAKAAKLSAQRQGNALRTLMSSDNGREWMWDLLSRCHVYHSSFDESALRMAYAEGERNIGNLLLAQIVSSVPELYLLMQKEASEADDRSNANPDGTGAPDDPDLGDPSGDTFGVGDAED